MAEVQENTIIEKFEGLPPNTVIDRLAGWATAHKLPFVAYRLPNEKHYDLLIGSAMSKVEEEALAGVDSGFLFSTYEGEHYFIDYGLSYNSANQTLKASSVWPANLSFEKIAIDANPWVPYSSNNDTPETKAEEYIQYVETCIAEINSSDLIKVVPSRTKKIKLDKDKSLSDIFLRLCEKYPNAFISILSTPKFGTWMGASPETLIEVNNQGIFSTMSLAGTQPHADDQPLHTLPWTQKEIEEQAMVSRYIINRFKEIRLREFEEVGPRTVKAGNLAHLCSIFKVDTVATNFPDLGSVMLKLLHPTSAVCGMPKPRAQTLLKSLEKHDRKLYSGYLGPVNMIEGSHIYVNLRCMEVLKEEAILYAGAGVTAYSIAPDEWQETELKCNTLLNIIEG